ncbi:NAD(P)-binding protein [Streptomyces sp. NRRL S-87]|uniref:NAD(P)-binding protein n=1 Tax=Streptomyces sp. NRRL S-87 TaxID=1463920 RepID=UPI0004C27613|nr:NAD(P)-binding protein [Streptomyces sp. NRRL S-87]
MTHVLVVGGGIGGLATALLAARYGHTVELFEGDPRAPGADPADALDREALDRAFFGRHRPAVPQATQPHALLGAARAVLRAELPDVYARMLELGARERHDLDWFDERPPARPGDEDLVTVQARRIVLESALGAAVRAEPGITAHHGERVRGLVAVRDRAGAPPRVTGVRTASGSREGELTVAAGGRRGDVERWLADAGCRPPLVERHRTGLAYLCRWYRLPEGRSDGPRRPWAVAGGRFAGCAVFPADNGTFAVTLFVHTTDPTRAALRDPAVFEAAARTFPPAAAWLDIGARPLSDVIATAALDNRWSALADGHGPVVVGLVPVGDAITHTNPTLGQGVSLALWAARRVATTVHEEPRSLGFATGYLAWARATLRPWFDFQVVADAALDQRFGIGALGGTAAPAAAPRETAALFECALTDPVVMRARARVRHLAETPARAYAAPDVKARVARWLAARPDYVPNAAGPDRATWEKLATR